MITARRIVDLSVVLDASTQVYPGDPQPRLSVATRIDTHGYNLLALELGSQSGTHVDSPYHFHADGARLEQCALELFFGPGVVIDATALAPRTRIGWDVVSPFEQRLRPGVIVALNTGWSDLHYGTPHYLEHPFLDGEACARMLDAGVRTFLIDAINLDETVLEEREPDFACHLAVARAGGIISENVRNLGALDFDPTISLFPVRLGGDADGAPCRVVALDLAGT